MAEYIEREAFIEDIKTEIVNLYLDGMKGTPRGNEELYQIIDRINEQPAADVVKRERGEWEPCFEDWRQQIEGDECSVCGFQHYGTSIERYHFCPNCGADMRPEGGAEG